MNGATTNTWRDLAIETAENYVPIELGYTDSENPARNWTLTIQQTPEPKIMLRGPIPTRGELAQALLNLTPGYWTIDMWLVLATIAEKQNANP